MTAVSESAWGLAETRLDRKRKRTASMKPAHLAQTVTKIQRIPLAVQNTTYLGQCPSRRIRTLHKPFVRLISSHAKYDTAIHEIASTDGDDIPIAAITIPT